MDPKVMRALILSTSGFICLDLVCYTLITVLAPGTDASPLLQIIAPTAASLAALGGISMVKRDTGKMLNGVMDKKIQDNVTTVLVDQGLGNGQPVTPAKPVHDPTNTITTL
jgi:hypothetical protein